MHSSKTAALRRQRFDQIVGVFHRDMYRYAAWLSRDKTIAEDVVQESLLRAWKSLEALRDDAAAKPWLLVDIDNLTASQAALLAEEPNDELDDMRQAIYELEDDYREPLVLQVLMGFSTNEIGEQMGLKQGAVLTRLHRARAKLREQMVLA